ncbi:MAG: hypothetical protein INR64_01755 [Caulobacteraceae bacterium]|nr:hypothetical protein [Caulobacter sp.]
MTRSDTPRLPAPIPSSPPRGEAVGRTGFAAHLLGQPGARHGLRAGEPALKGARTAYLSAQWRGADDRRPTAGFLRRVVV